MKKTFSTMLLTAMLFAFGALPAAVHADEPQTGIPAERLEEAKKYYVESGINGFKVGLKIAGGKTLSPKQIEKARKLIAAWLNDDLIPFLRENGVLEEWVALQFDPEVRAINQKAADVATREDIMKIAGEGMELMSTRYSNFNSKVNTPQGAQLMQKLQSILMQVMMDKEE
jgi:hypothetical protein